MPRGVNNFTVTLVFYELTDPLWCFFFERRLITPQPKRRLTSAWLGGAFLAIISATTLSSSNHEGNTIVTFGGDTMVAVFAGSEISWWWWWRWWLEMRWLSFRLVRDPDTEFPRFIVRHLGSCVGLGLLVALNSVYEANEPFCFTFFLPIIDSCGWIVDCCCYVVAHGSCFNA